MYSQRVQQPFWLITNSKASVFFETEIGTVLQTEALTTLASISFSWNLLNS